MIFFHYVLFSLTSDAPNKNICISIIFNIHYYLFSKKKSAPLTMTQAPQKSLEPKRASPTLKITKTSENSLLHRVAFATPYMASSMKFKNLTHRFTLCGVHHAFDGVRHDTQNAISLSNLKFTLFISPSQPPPIPFTFPTFPKTSFIIPSYFHLPLSFLFKPTFTITIFTILTLTYFPPHHTSSSKISKV